MILDRLLEHPEMLPEDFDYDSWLKNTTVIKIGDDYGLFERDREGVVVGHYLFKSRGKAAIEVAKKILDEIFKTEDVVIGIIPEGNKKVSYISRRVGFTIHDDVAILTKDMWNG